MRKNAYFIRFQCLPFIKITGNFDVLDSTFHRGPRNFLSKNHRKFRYCKCSGKFPARRAGGGKGSSIHREPRKNITVFHQEILLQEKVRNWNTPKGREGVRGTKTASRYSTLRRKATLREPGVPPRVTQTHNKNMR